MIHFTSPAGWLPVHRDQLRAQRSVTSMGKLFFIWHSQLFTSVSDSSATETDFSKVSTVLQFTHWVGREFQELTTLLLLQLQTIMHRKRAIYSSNSGVFSYRRSGRSKGILLTHVDSLALRVPHVRQSGFPLCKHQRQRAQATYTPVKSSTVNICMFIYLFYLEIHSWARYAVQSKAELKWQ